MAAIPTERLFAADPCSEGWTVVDTQTGRPLTGPRSQRSALATAQNLNAAAARGVRSLAKALGCVGDDDEDALL